MCTVSLVFFPLGAFLPHHAVIGGSILPCTYIHTYIVVDLSCEDTILSSAFLVPISNFLFVILVKISFSPFLKCKGEKKLPLSAAAAVALEHYGR